MAELKKLPIGIEDFEKIQQEGIHKIIKYGIACYKKKCKVMMKIEEQNLYIASGNDDMKQRSQLQFTKIYISKL